MQSCILQKKLPQKFPHKVGWTVVIINANRQQDAYPDAIFLQIHIIIYELATYRTTVPNQLQY